MPARNVSELPLRRGIPCVAVDARREAEAGVLLTVLRVALRAGLAPDAATFLGM